MTPRKVLTYAADHGVIRTLHRCFFQLAEIWNEWWYGIDTGGYVDLKTFGIANSECNNYTPIGYLSLKAAMRHIPMRPGEDVFVDYGAGKGRVVVVAATYPFRRVIGVELLPGLADKVRENIRRAGNRIRCQNIQIEEIDATRFPLPEDATIIHFFNPFRGEILSAVARNIRESMERTSRKVTILFAYYDDFERLLREECFPSKWTIDRHDVSCPHFERDGNDRNVYRIYGIDPVKG